MEWQIKDRENGYHVERLSGGQLQAYGPTEYQYIIICLDPHIKESEVREYCTTKVQRAHDPMLHSLLMHLIEFKRIGPRTYYYKCGHDWTG